MSKMDGIDTLPDNILLQIIELFRPEVKLLSLQLVCRRWWAIVDVSWASDKRLCNISVADFISLLPKCGVHLEEISLNLVGSNYLRLNALFHLLAANQCKKLKQLKLQNFRIGSEDEIDGEAVKALESLQSISFVNPAPNALLDFTDDFIRPILQNLTKLKHLEVDAAPAMTGEFISFLVGRLETLHFEPGVGSRIPATLSPGAFSSLQTHTGIRKLVLGKLRLQHQEFQAFCERAVNLQCLYIRGHQFVTNGAELTCLGLLRSLTDLRAVSCGPLVGDNAVRLLSLNCPQIRHLSLYKSSISDAGVCHLKRLQNLKMVDLSHCKNIHDWSLINTLPALTELSQLYLCACEGINGLFFPIAIQFCKKLSKVGLSYCDNLGRDLIELSADFLMERTFPLEVFATSSSFSVAKLFASPLCQHLPLTLSLAINEVDHRHLEPPPFDTTF